MMRNAMRNALPIFDPLGRPVRFPFWWIGRTSGGMGRRKRVSTLSPRELAADNRRWRDRAVGTLGPASPCRRIDPVSGKTVEVIDERRVKTDSKTGQTGTWALSES